MNWQQLYTASTPAEREEILILMLQTIEAHQQRLILARGRLVRNRRQKLIAHFLGDRRLAPRPTHITQFIFLFILATLSVSTWLIASHIQPMYAAPLIFGYNLLLLAILTYKPHRRISLSVRDR
jgi:hypothetical protein